MSVTTVTDSVCGNVMCHLYYVKLDNFMEIKLISLMCASIDLMFFGDNFYNYFFRELYLVIYICIIN